MVTRSITILDELDIWINNFRAKMLKHQNQSVSYTATLNLIGRLGALILSQPEKLTDEQKHIIRGFIEESNGYHPPYARIKWAEKYLEYMIPKVLDGTVNEPWELKKLRKQLSCYTKTYEPKNDESLVK